MHEHVHDTTSFCLVLAGSYQETIRGGSTVHEAGALLVCPAHEPHAQRFGAGGLYKLVFQPTGDTLARLGDVIRLSEAPALHSRAVADVGRRLVTELRRDDPFSAMVIEGLSHELVGLFARGHATGGRLPGYLTKAVDYVRAADTATLSLAQVAADIGCDGERLSQAFRRYLGCTLGDYQRRLRVERAAAMLAGSRMSISDIAHSCGFADQPHLNRVFKAQIGTTPAAYRRNLR